MTNQIESARLADEKLILLVSKTNNTIERVRKNKRENQKKASGIKIVAVILSSIVTILLGLQIAGREEVFINIAFVLGALVTLVNALEPFFNFRSLWVEHELALWKFYHLRDDLDFYLAGIEKDEVELAVVKQYYDRYQRIWTELSKAWISYRKSEPYD